MILSFDTLSTQHNDFNFSSTFRVDVRGELWLSLVALKTQEI